MAGLAERRQGGLLGVRLSVVFLAVLFATAALAQTSTARLSEPPLDVTYCALAQNPYAFIGKQIRVRAIYVHSFEVQHFESPQCCPARLGIWVDWDLEMDRRSRRLFNRLDKHPGLALGTFVGRLEGGSHYGHMAAPFQLAHTHIEKLDRDARATRPENYPAWAPRNCERSNADRLVK